MKKDGKNVQAHLKLWLLSGKTVTHNQALHLWRTNRIAEYVRRLRKEGMVITTEMVSYEGDTFGVYKYIAPKKINRITEGTYPRV